MIKIIFINRSWENHRKQVVRIFRVTRRSFSEGVSYLSPVLLSKDRKLVVYLPAGRQEAENLLLAAGQALSV